MEMEKGNPDVLIVDGSGKPLLEQLGEENRQLREEIVRLKQVEAALRDQDYRLSEILLGYPTPQFVIDGNHRVVFWNRALEAYSGIKASEIVGTNRHWQAFYSSGRPCLADFLVDNAENGIALWYEGKFSKSKLLPDCYECTDFFPDLPGEGKWLHFKAVKMKDVNGVTIGAIETLNDITDRKLAENKLQHAYNELDERVKARTRELEAANKELESFAYSVSHDLRTPLRAIDGFSQALLEEYDDKLDEQGKDYLNRLRAGSQRMGVLIDNILRLSRLSREEMHYESVDLSALADEIAEELRSGEPDRHADFFIAPCLMVRGDPALFRIAMQNLLANAWKFTSLKEYTRIEFGAKDIKGEKVFYVSDNGAGFDMAYGDKLFGVFQRLHGAKEFPGTGIGLAIVQRVISRHGGRVWAEAEVDKGATLYFVV
ncbi:MAG: PAS domain-containing protein [Desulfuromonadales bacterium]|nr:PAS domain-containing protein [Desulfuromonadales bacterium]